VAARLVRPFSLVSSVFWAPSRDRKQPGHMRAGTADLGMAAKAHGAAERTIALQS